MVLCLEESATTRRLGFVKYSNGAVFTHDEVSKAFIKHANKAAYGMKSLMSLHSNFNRIISECGFKDKYPDLICMMRTPVIGLNLDLNEPISGQLSIDVVEQLKKRDRSIESLSDNLPQTKFVMMDRFTIAIKPNNSVVLLKLQTGELVVKSWLCKLNIYPEIDNVNIMRHEVALLCALVERSQNEP